MSSGNFAPPWLTKYAGPVKGTGTMGDTAVADPILESWGHAAGFWLNVLSGQAFCRVVNRDGSCLGKLTLRDVFPYVETWNFGLNASFAQFVTWNGVDRFAVAP